MHKTLQGALFAVAVALGGAACSSDALELRSDTGDAPAAEQSEGSPKNQTDDAGLGSADLNGDVGDLGDLGELADLDGDLIDLDDLGDLGDLEGVEGLEELEELEQLLDELEDLNTTPLEPGTAEPTTPEGIGGTLIGTDYCNAVSELRRVSDSNTASDPESIQRWLEEQGPVTDEAVRLAPPEASADFDLIGQNFDRFEREFVRVGYNYLLVDLQASIPDIDTFHQTQLRLSSFNQANCDVEYPKVDSLTEDRAFWEAGSISGFLRDQLLEVTGLPESAVDCVMDTIDWDALAPLPNPDPAYEAAVEEGFGLCNIG